MHPSRRVDSGDRTLVQIVDAAMAEAVRKSGAWLACRVGCTQCCLGPFPITELDARRLRRGLAELAAHDPQRAARVLERAREAVIEMAADFPGDARTGLIERDDEPFCDQFADEPCPALDPVTGACDLYTARPVTCRTFGPAVRGASGALGICELCYQGATEGEIAACEVEIDPDGLEAALLDELGAGQETFVAFALMAGGREPGARG